MKKYLIIIILFFTITPKQTDAQAPSWLWAQSAGGTGADVPHTVTTDALGNVYIAGYYMSTSIPFGSTTLVNTSGGSNIFLAKYDGNGNVLWAKSAGGTNLSAASSVSLDASGNINVAGTFGSPSITFGSTILTNNKGGFSDIFIAKYDASGNVLWAKGAGGRADDVMCSATTDALGNIYVVGYFLSDTLKIGSTNLINASGHDIFIIKYASNGNFLWAKSAGGTDINSANSVSTDALGNVYIAGQFGSSSINFGGITLTNAGGDDIFIVKYDGTGNVLWAKSVGGAGIETANSISIDTLGNVYIAGRFMGSTITFGSTTLTNDSAGAYDIFIAKYNSGGNAIWATRAGATSSDGLNNISSDASGNVYVVGWFSAPYINFGSMNLTNIGLYDVFIAKYDSSGNLLWVKSAGGTAYDSPTGGVSTDVSGNVYILGYFGSSSITFGSTTLTNAGSNDIFIAKSNGVTAIEKIDKRAQIDIFPNPFSSEAILQMTCSLHNATITLDNIFGQTVKQITSLTIQPWQHYTLQKGNLPSGIYFLRINEGNNLIATAKLIITD